MAELIRNAWLGWGRFAEGWKAAALFFAALLFLGLCRRRETRRQLVLYASVSAVCCMVPVTAALLMLYQTRFYDYEWIWSLVPLTAVTAYGFAEFLVEYWKDFKGSLWKKGVPVTLLLLGTALLCSGMGGTAWNGPEEARHRAQAESLLRELRGLCGEEICLWAPESVMEYARESDGAVRLAYGRNMWDVSLNAYSYDVYDQPVRELYQWMKWAEAGEKTGEAAVKSCAETVKARGINCVVLPGTMDEETIAEWEAALGTGAVRVGASGQMFALYRSGEIR